MSIPAIPTGFQLQQANGSALLSWNIAAGATSYQVSRSTDGVTYAITNSPVVNSYLDTTVTVGTLYYYKVASTNASGTSGYCTAQATVPCNTGDMSLLELRLRARQRADMVNSTFVTDSEFNSYINQSYFELYDLLVTVYENYFLKTPYSFQTTTAAQYTLPSDFYKLVGVDAGLSNSNQAWVTVPKFDFIERNQWIYPQVSSTALGIGGLRYRLMGNTLFLTPTPSSGQYIQVWYIPKLTQLLQDIDICVGVSGWTEYIICDVAIKAMQKEESDVSVLGQQKMMLIKRIEESAMNRDVGMPDKISDTRSNTSFYNGYPNGNFGGF